MRLFILLLLLSSCFSSSKLSFNGKGNISFKEVSYNDLENWNEVNHQKALQSFNHSCNKFAKMPQNKLVGGQIGSIFIKDFRDVCDIADVVRAMDSKQAKNFFENWFRPLKIATRSGRSRGLFTGYYEASLKGNVRKTDKYRHPIYKVPTDLTYEPYYSRQEIESGVLSSKGLEILYVDNIVDLFFLHIQGSGRVELPDGSNVRISYAGRNNHPYTSVGGYMVDKGYISADHVNAKTIMKWLNDNPIKAIEVMNQNAAYTFFELSKNEYVVGAQNVPLTAMHSIAIDNDYIPYGLPIWVETHLKDADKNKVKFNNLLIAQDTGSAIRGAVRGDIFFGFGKVAQDNASYMASKGEYYLLIPVNIVDNLRKNN
ncbi:MltA domain-containing protein [Rickettsiales bacterium]|nr:MltA domain-containing protein [Rickettsiales bacterium]